jgi:hypothetical protein
MTTLISWISYDPKFAAAYMASDSRITWWKSATRRWDAGRKIFPSRRFPDILGYAGDVIFPALALSQIIEAVDAGLLFGPTATPWERHANILESLRESFERRHKADDQDFSILHLSRWDEGRSRTAHAWSIHFDAKTKNWADCILAIPTETGVIERLGTGAIAAKTFQKEWNKTAAYSREIFSSFCDAISSGADPLSGGAPQLAGFYPKGHARPFGVYYNNEAFFNGLPLTVSNADESIEWRDRLFQRIDIATGRLVEGAQVHARPRAP